MIRALILGLGGVILAGAAAAEGDPAAGRKIAGQCRTCHGLDGYAQIPIAPHIGGEPAGYLESQLLAFKTGARQHEMMTIVAGSLSEQQIAVVAAGRRILGKPADAAEAPEQCVACHGADGIGQTGDVPNLAGETNIYIDTQLKAFRLGKRDHEVMSAIAADLTDAEIRAAADWYAAVTLEIEAAP